MWKREPSYTAGGNVNWCSHCGNSMRFLKRLKLQLPYIPAIPLLGIYLKKPKNTSLKGTCTSTFIATLITVAKVWKQLQCSPTDELIKEMQYTCIYNRILLSHKKRRKFHQWQQHGWTWKALC